MSAKITAALHQVMAKVGYVQKTGKNAFHGYSYAGEADLLAVLRPAMIEAGLLLLPSNKFLSHIDEHGNVTVLIEYTLAHKDGDIWPEKLVAAGMGNDRAKNGTVGDKGLYKAITGANKYLLFKLFQIETGDDPETADLAHETEAPTLPKAKSRDLYAEMQSELYACQTKADLAGLWNSPAFKTEFAKLKPDWKELLTQQKDSMKEAFDNGTRAAIPPQFAPEPANG